MSANHSLTYLDNGTLKLGVDTTWGGAIVYLSVSGSGTNLINRYDAGRLVQQSYYGAGQYVNCGWGLNPVQGGDMYNNPSGIIEHYNTGELIYVKSRPLDWCLQNDATACIMENWYRLKDNTVKVTARFSHNESSMGLIRDQELPAIFTPSSLDRFTRYSGTDPFASGGITTNTPGYPNELHYQSEGWGTHLDAGGIGLGWYTPNVYYSTNYMYVGAGSTGEYGDRTAYSAPLYRFALAPGSVYQYEYYLIIGTAEDVRATAYHYNVRTASSWNFDFAGDREGWSLSSHADGSGPHNGIWSMNPPVGTSFVLVSPPVTIPASRNLVQIRLSNATGATSLTISWQRSGKQELHGGVFSNSVTIPIANDGQFATYTCDMSGVASWTGLIQSIKLSINPTIASSFSSFDIDWFRIRSEAGSAPVISNVEAEAPCGYFAVVSFNTDTAATARVEYGPDFAYGFHSPDNINLSCTHQVYLSGLQSGQTYHYRVRTREAGGHETVSSDHTFTTPVRVKVKQWEFEQAGNLEGWSFQHQVTGVVTGGALVLTSTGNDPYVWSPDLLSVIDPSRFRYIRIRLKNSTSDKVARFFFITDADPAWNAVKSIAFTISANDADYKEYAVDMAANSNWTGTIRRFRFDPFGTTGIMLIDWIQITD
ncbi:fibronectin type III domain-containing protein [Paenibacillus senegalensis]|uniref:fibronectin type III domain-containing protein n=1 Tax=Paenibacillus senegalensis TaxID=1465766 RepID=UPI000289B545|nr:fibronectin type III domain-containing protein [Paenibacillus senegalensis]